MEVHFTPELQAKLDSAASGTHTDPDDYVQQLVERYLDHDVWFRQKVAGSVKQLESRSRTSSTAPSAATALII